MYNRSCRLSSARNFIACSLSQKSGTRQSSGRGRGIDLVNEPFVEGDINSDRSTGICQQRHGQQKSATRRRGSHVLVAHDVIDCPRRRDRSASTLQGFDVLTQGHRGIRGRFRQSITRRKTSLDIRKPDAECTVGVFLDNRYVLRRHARIISHNHWTSLSGQSRRASRPPSSQFVNAPHESNRQILAWVRDRNEFLAVGMLERVVISIDPVENPSVLFQHPDQLAAVSFHMAHLVECSRSDRQQFLMLERAGMIALPTVLAGISRPVCVYIYTQKYR